MKKIILILTIFLSTTLNVSAQKITNAEELKRFYTEYFTYSVNLSDQSKIKALITDYCTQQFAKAWNEDVNEIGLYDPLTDGACENQDLMKNTLIVKKNEDNYVVSFHCLTWPDEKTVTISVIVYVNADGKISHTKRPSDGYITPAEQSPDV